MTARDSLYPPHAYQAALFGADQCGLCGAPYAAPVHALPVDTDPRHHHRTDAPDTSREAAAALNIPAQCRRVLGSYATGDALTDHDAYRRAGLDTTIHGARSRCSDLRGAGLIAWTGDYGLAPSGRRARLSQLTALGAAYLTREGSTA